MRDYKNVKVPRRYRSANSRTSVKRVEAGPGRKRGSGSRLSLGPVFVVIFAVCAGYGAWTAYQWITHAGTFQIAAVDVKGVRRLDESEIKEMVRVFTGQNIFRVDLGEAAARAAANPWVKDVRIERRLPNRIRMTIAEHEPFAVLEAGSGRFLIDAAGTVIIPAGKDPGDAGPLPTIVIRDCRPSLREQVAAGGIGEALELLPELALRGGWDMGRVRVKAESPESVAVLYADHEFRMGSGNYAEKLRRLGEIVSDMQTRNLAFAYVELRPERQAAVMVKKDGSKGQAARGRGNRK